MNRTIRLLFLELALVLPQLLSAQVEDVVARKNFPFLTGLDRNPCAYELVKSDPVLSRLAAETYAALEAEEDGTAALALYQCSDAEIAQASRRLAELSAEAPMKALADSLRRSGAYSRCSGSRAGECYQRGKPGGCPRGGMEQLS